ncbi:MAG: UDP-N-acetylglucosamine 2-epimerase [Planctomycetota bacterium]|jgi:UDP-N-acetylglucosamine 2-epimerase (non-hydrolysing)/GDP/UDP-N,N'-diacetylbacillosamine 2-epimerase (hydrolysing)
MLIRVLNLAIVTSSRADWGHLAWPLHDLCAHPAVSPRLIVTGSHLLAEFGSTVEVIERGGFDIAARVECLVPGDDGDAAMGRAIGRATTGFTDVLAALRPDLVLVVADRFEMLGPAAAALALRIPIVHLEGGEASEGAIDQAIRNALTMMSALHLAPTELAARRLIAMGEAPDRVTVVGAPSLDHLRRTALPSRAEVSEALDLPLDRDPIVAAYHPVTLDVDTAASAEAVFAALRTRREPIVFTYPNADAGGRAIAARVERFIREEHPDAHLRVSLEPRLYWGLLRCAAAMVGNSSSGIMESPSLGLPAVDVGRRQQGRERAANIIGAPADSAALIDALERALDPAFRNDVQSVGNPYGDGDASSRIVAALTSGLAVPPEGVAERTAWREALLAKRALAVGDPVAS